MWRNRIILEFLPIDPFAFHLSYHNGAFGLSTIRLCSKLNINEKFEP